MLPFRLFVHCKDTNLKAIHNRVYYMAYILELFVHCKDTNLKAIHNAPVKPYLIRAVVRALQRY